MHNYKEKSLFVKCIARPDFDMASFSEFLDVEGTDWHRTSGATKAEEVVEIAGRVCYMSFGTKQSKIKNADFISNLLQKGHESVLEHVSWTFIISGVSRAFTHQLVRHRVGVAFSQLSQQYYEENEPTFIKPQKINESPDLLSSWEKSALSAFKTYREILEKNKKDNALNKVCKQEALREVRSTARSILPNATETKILVTANARAIRHFLDIRGALEGDPEMRAVCFEIYKIVNADAPALFSDFVVDSVYDGTTKIIKEEDL